MVKTSKKLGYLYLLVFAILIVGGIVTKRVYGDPEFMMLWHLPAAVFLVLSGMNLMRASRADYELKKANRVDANKIN